MAEFGAGRPKNNSNFLTLVNEPYFYYFAIKAYLRKGLRPAWVASTASIIFSAAVVDGIVGRASVRVMACSFRIDRAWELPWTWLRRLTSSSSPIEDWLTNLICRLWNRNCQCSIQVLDGDLHTFLRIPRRKNRQIAVGTSLLLRVCISYIATLRYSK